DNRCSLAFLSSATADHQSIFLHRAQISTENGKSHPEHKTCLKSIRKRCYRRCDRSGDCRMRRRLLNQASTGRSDNLTGRWQVATPRGPLQKDDLYNAKIAQEIFQSRILRLEDSGSTQP